MTIYSKNTVRVAQSFNEAKLGSIVEINGDLYIVGSDPHYTCGAILVNLATGSTYGSYANLEELNRTLLDEITNAGSDEPPLMRITVYNDVDILITKK